MKDIELKKIIAKLLQEGSSLSEIQKILDKEHKHQITFLDLRILSAELENIDWKQFDPVKEIEEELDEAPVLNGTGETIIELSKIQVPGTLVSGSVIFATGAKSNWSLDQMGQLGLDKQIGEPTKEDLEQFQAKLQEMLSKQM